MRYDHPQATVITENLVLAETAAVFKSTITLPNGAVGVGHGSETKGDFVDFIEKSETKAVGRALAMLGYDTAGLDLDEGGVPATTPPGGYGQPQGSFNRPPQQQQPHQQQQWAPQPQQLPPPLQYAAPPHAPGPAIVEPDDRPTHPRSWTQAGMVIDTFEYVQDPNPLAPETETSIRNLAHELGLPIYGLVFGVNMMEAGAVRAGKLTQAGDYTQLSDFPEQLGVDIRDNFLVKLYETTQSLAAPEYAVAQ
jgi:hypothetical protein